MSESRTKRALKMQIINGYEKLDACSNCFAVVDVEDNYCHSCGAELIGEANTGEELRK